MKVDGLGIILAIILLPIILVVTYYIQLQVDTIAKENTYNTKLLDATYDAMYAFESNTANEELSSVADSMRSIVLASNNVFLNSLATNLGISNASKEHLQPYIPAILYTMYDGYYIYAPTETKQVAEKVKVGDNGLITTDGYLSVGDTGVKEAGGSDYTYALDDDGNATATPTYNDSAYGDILYKKENQDYNFKPNSTYTFTSNPEEAKEEPDYVLKSYVQYSARYATSNIDITINYTLDNYLNIVGTIDDVYYTKTGYLIKNGLVSDPNADGDLSNYNEDDAKEKILGKQTNANETTIDAAKNVSVKVNSEEIKAEWRKIQYDLNALGYYKLDNGAGYPNIRTISEAEIYLKKAYEEKDLTNIGLLNAVQNLEYEIGKYKAIAYYTSSMIFSNWVYEKLGTLTYDDIKTNYPKYETTSKTTDLFFDFHNGSVGARTIFKDTTHPDPEDSESNFNTHKLEVIKNSIKYNLNLSISSYCKMQSKFNKDTAYDFSMPVLLDEEWDKILSNISIVAFMQGWDCGLNIYNNYQMVSSTNNELTVTPSEIYYVPKDKFNNSQDSYHRIDCPYLGGSDEYISFKSKEVKYDPIYDSDSYQYDHKNLACYTCINGNNYDNGLFKNRNDQWYLNNNKKYTSYYDRISSMESAENKRIASYIGLAKERQSTYKMNALPASEGYQVFNLPSSNSNNGSVTITNLSAIDVTGLKKLQITLRVTENKPRNHQENKLQTLKLKISNGTNEKKSDINLIQNNEQTIVIDVSGWSGNLNNINISPDSNIEAHDIQYRIKSIKAIYK